MADNEDPPRLIEYITRENMERELRGGPDRVVSLGSSEQDRAAKLRAAVDHKLQELCGLLDSAKRDGMLVQFQLGDDAFGRQSVQMLRVIKLLA